MDSIAKAAFETVTIKGDDPGLEEGQTALQKGALVSEMSLTFKADDQRWRFTLKGESLHVTGLRVPDTGPVQTEADLDGAIIEKVFLVERALRLVDGLFSRFIQVRISGSWQGETVAAMQKWIGK